MADTEAPAKCWRCGGKPHEHTTLKPRRPVCAECALALLFAALGDEDEDVAAIPERKP